MYIYIYMASIDGLLCERSSENDRIDLLRIFNM